MSDAAALRIEGGLLLPGAGEPPFFGWVEIRDGRIGAIGRGAAAPDPALRTLDASGRALLPGLVNAHAHSHSSLTRGSAEGMKLEAWIETIEREQTLLSDADAYVAALATYAEALLSGTTTVLDMCLRPEPAMRAARDLGIRLVVAPYVLDGRSFAPQLADVRALLESHGATRDRVSVWVGLHDLETCSDATIAAGAALAAEFGTGLHLHCAESRYAVGRTQRRSGRSPIAQLAALGALGERTVLAHCVWADGEDQRLLSATQTSVAHCPHANLKLASGIAPVPEMLGAGINVALATDGAKANNRLDMFDVMKFASLLHKGTHLDAELLAPALVVDMATAGGARAVGLDGGRLQPGALADLVLVDLRQFHLVPGTPDAITTNLVHAARGSDVQTVIVGGEVVVDDGRLVRIDGAAILAEMQSASLRLLAATGR